MKHVLILALFFGSLPGCAASVPQPSHMTPGCRASFDNAVHAVIATPYGTSLGQFTDPSQEFTQRVIMNPGPSRFPIAVQGLQGDYEPPVCVASDGNLSVYISLDVLSDNNSPIMGSFSEDNSFVANYFVQFRPGSPPWKRVVGEIRRSGKSPVSASTFRFIEFRTVYSPKSGTKIRIALVIDRQGMMMGTAGIAPPGAGPESQSMAFLRFAARNTYILLARMSDQPEVSEQKRNYIENRRQWAKIDSEKLGLNPDSIPATQPNGDSHARKCAELWRESDPAFQSECEPKKKTIVSVPVQKEIDLEAGTKILVDLKYSTSTANCSVGKIFTGFVPEGAPIWIPGTNRSIGSNITASVTEVRCDPPSLGQGGILTFRLDSVTIYGKTYKMGDAEVSIVGSSPSLFRFSGRKLKRTPLKGNNAEYLTSMDLMFHSQRVIPVTYVSMETFSK